VKIAHNKDLVTHVFPTEDQVDLFLGARLKVCSIAALNHR
jgi:hypothetical protein